MNDGYVGKTSHRPVEELHQPFRQEQMMLPEIQYLFDAIQHHLARWTLEHFDPLVRQEAQTCLSGHCQKDVADALHTLSLWGRHVIFKRGGSCVVCGRTPIVYPELILG